MVTPFQRHDQDISRLGGAFPYERVLGRIVKITERYVNREIEDARPVTEAHEDIYDVQLVDAEFKPRKGRIIRGVFAQKPLWSARRGQRKEIDYFLARKTFAIDNHTFDFVLTQDDLDRRQTLTDHSNPNNSQTILRDYYVPRAASDGVEGTLVVLDVFRTGDQALYTIASMIPELTRTIEPATREGAAGGDDKKRITGDVRIVRRKATEEELGVLNEGRSSLGRLFGLQRIDSASVYSLDISGFNDPDGIDESTISPAWLWHYERNENFPFTSNRRVSRPGDTDVFLGAFNDLSFHPDIGPEFNVLRDGWWAYTEDGAELWVVDDSAATFNVANIRKSDTYPVTLESVIFYTTNNGFSKSTTATMRFEAP